MVCIVKLGGSVITRVDSSDPFDLEQTARLARELRDADKPVILVHGTGHVGKPFATEHGFVRDGRLSADRKSLAGDIRAALRRLNEQVMTTLHAEGVAARRIPASSIFSGDTGAVRDAAAIEQLHGHIERRVVPVLHGDLMHLSDGSFRVLSSDAMTSNLAASIRPSSVVYLSDVDGVYGYAPDRSMAQSPMSRVTKSMLDKVYRSDSDLRDVSGGMRRKLEAALEAARYSSRCLIASGRRPGMLAAALCGTPTTCTEVVAEQAAC